MPEERSEEWSLQPQSPARTLPPRRRVAISYLIRLVVLVPAVGVCLFAINAYHSVPAGGVVDAVKLLTKPGPVGQVREAKAQVEPGTADLYLVIATAGGEVKTNPFKDTPVGNGLTWNLPRTMNLHDIQRVDVWDYNSLYSDEYVDRINMGDWAAEGQTYRIELQGRPNMPPGWALPTAAASGAVAGMVLLRFLWDQVV